LRMVPKAARDLRDAARRALSAVAPRRANVRHVFVKACTRVNDPPKTGTSPLVSASGACEASAGPSAPGPFSRALVRSASTSRSSAICCVPRSIASNWLRASTPGVSSRASPNIRLPPSESQPPADVAAAGGQLDDARAGQNPPERMAGVSIAKDAPILYRSDRNEHKAPENGEHRLGCASSGRRLSSACCLPLPQREFTL
jgi:hypothetical protein